MTTIKNLLYQLENRFDQGCRTFHSAYQKRVNDVVNYVSNFIPTNKGQLALILGPLVAADIVITTTGCGGGGGNSTYNTSNYNTIASATPTPAASATPIEPSATPLPTATPTATPTTVAITSPVLYDVAYDGQTKTLIVMLYNPDQTNATNNLTLSLRSDAGKYFGDVVAASILPGGYQLLLAPNPVEKADIAGKRLSLYNETQEIGGETMSTGFPVNPTYVVSADPTPGDGNARIEIGGITPNGPKTGLLEQLSGFRGFAPIIKDSADGKWYVKFEGVSPGIGNFSLLDIGSSNPRQADFGPNP